jgi:hypothetical protein
MLELYRIDVQHFAPNDEHRSIETYVVALREHEVYDAINDMAYGCWNDRNDDGVVYEIFDDAWNVIGTETYKERMMRLKGDINDEDEELSDLYYGRTLYGWENLGEIAGEEINLLSKFGMLYVKKVKPCA